MHTHIRGRCALILAVMLVLTVLSSAAVARADSPASPDEGSPPTVVRELPEKRTANSDTYLLSNGAYRTEVYASPVNYQSADGAWQAIDTTLVPTADFAEWRSAATPLSVTLGDESLGECPVRLAYDGATLGLDMLGVYEAAPLVLADGATYPALATDSQLRYRVLRDGLEQTIELASAAAPASYSCRVEHPGLELRRDASGGWGFYRPAALGPTFVVGGLCVYDSSLSDAGEPAFCDDAAMRVEPGEGASLLTYSLPEQWLSDPARVFPVTIDPIFDYDDWAWGDTYISSKYKTTDYGGANHLEVGKLNASTGKNRALVKFNLSSLSEPSYYVKDATFKIYQYYLSSGGAKPTYVGIVQEPWTESSTWDDLMPLDYSYHGTQNVAADSWLEQPCRVPVQHWLNEEAEDDGFVIYQQEDGSQDGTHYRKFRSVEYVNQDYLPQLHFNYATPQASVSGYESVYRWGDTVTATLTVNCAYPNDVRAMKLGVNRASGDSDRYRGVLAWFAYDPGEGWEKLAASGGGYVAYLTGSTYGGDHIVPDLETTRTTVETGSTFKRVTFSFELSDEDDAAHDLFGDIQHNSFDSFVYMGPDEENTWDSGWVNQGSDVNIVPQPVGALAYECEASDWFSEADANGDGIADEPCDEDGYGRGDVTLDWDAAPVADGYHIYLFDGGDYREVGETSSTSWSSAGKGIYPSDSEIAAVSWPGGAGGNPFYHAGEGDGLDLRDNPAALYAATDGGSYDQATNYCFVVAPYSDEGGERALTDNAAALVGLDNRTVHVSEAPRHTSYDLGEFAGHTCQALIDEHTLELEVTDLEIASFGPRAALDRYYYFPNGMKLFSYGWRFSFERSLTVNGTVCDYTDAVGEQYRFFYLSGAWRAPNGLTASLAQDGSDWTLTFKDRTVLSFDSGGVLQSEADANGNTVTYDWGEDDLTIEAANGQEIAVGFDLAGDIDSASYATNDGERVVDYAGAGGTTPQVTYFPGEDEQRSVSYAYTPGKGAKRLITIRQLDWPESGMNADETFAYDTSNLTDIYFADYDALGNPDARAEISYGANDTAEVVRRGSVDGVANTAIYEDFASNPTGTKASSAGPWSGAEQSADYTRTSEYSPDNQCSRETKLAPNAKTSNSLYDVRGNLTAAFDELEHCTSYAYDANDLLTSETDPLGSLTSYAYDANGNPTSQEKVLNEAEETACTTYDYDDVAAGGLTMHGALVEESRKIGEEDWATTVYDDFAANGAACTTTSLAVDLYDPEHPPSSPPTSPVDLTAEKTYDEFGNLESATDTSGQVVETNTYDLAGRLVTSTDAAEVVTHHLYDVLCYGIESWQSHASSSVKANWTKSYTGTLSNPTEYGYDAMERQTKVWTYLHDGTTATLQSTVTCVYDGRGLEIGSGDSTIGGEAALTHYDARGNQTAAWAEGGPSYDIERASRSTFDTLGQEVQSWAAGADEGSPENPTWTDFTYNDDGNLQGEIDHASDSATSYLYDAAGKTIRETESPGTADESITESSHDLGGRLLAQTENKGTDEEAVTTYSYDLLDRQLLARLGGEQEPSSSSTYNSLGWMLTETDADEIVATTLYDSAGRVVAETTAGETTSSTYDAAGRLIGQTDPDASLLEYAYDCFGNTSEEKHTVGANLVKEILTDHDSLGRPTESEDQLTGISHAWSYPENEPPDPQDATETLSYGTVPTAVSLYRGADGLESGRSVDIAGETPLELTVDSRDSADRITETTLSYDEYDPVVEHASYDDAGRLVRRWGTGFTAGAATSDAYYYDSDTDRKIADNLRLSLGGTISASYNYTAAGRLDEATIGSLTATHSFDTAGNLTRVVEGPTTTTTLSYGAGSRLAQVAKTGAQTVSVSWDQANGRRDYQGPASDPDQIDYAFSQAGYLTGYANAATAKNASYAYDAAGQRTSSTVNGSTRSFLYDGLTLLEVAKSGHMAWRISYLYDEAVAAYAGVYREGTGAPVPFAIVTSDRGDVVELTDAAGDAFARYRYDAWGNPLSDPVVAETDLITASLAADIAARQVLRYAGYVYDSESGLYYCAARYYDPATRQWISKDSANADGEESAYQYCGGDPVGACDPEGEKLLKVPKVNQAWDTWCGPACGRSIIRWYWPNRDWSARPGVGQGSTTPTQAHLVSYVYWNSDPRRNPPWLSDHITTCLWGWSVASHIRDASLISADDIRTEINNDRPMIVGTTRPQHWWVLCGFYKSGGANRVWLMNPDDFAYRTYKTYTLKYFRAHFGMDVVIRTSRWWQ